MRSEVTVARLADVKELANLLMKMHANCGVPLPPVNPEKLFTVLEFTILRGVIFKATVRGKIVGAIGLEVVPYWYGDAVFVADRFFYVDEAFRGSDAAVELLQAAKDYANINHIPLTIATVYGVDVEKKDNFLMRKGFTRLGGVFHWKGDD